MYSYFEGTDYERIGAGMELVRSPSIRGFWIDTLSKFRSRGRIYGSADVRSSGATRRPAPHYQALGVTFWG